jgi:hypothetical protein
MVAGRQDAITRGHRDTYMVSGDDWRAGVGRNACGHDPVEKSLLVLGLAAM